MQGEHNDAGSSWHKVPLTDGWSIVEQTQDRADGRRRVSWAHAPGQQWAAVAALVESTATAEGAERGNRLRELIERFPPSRRVWAKHGSGLRLDGHDGRIVFVNLPARMVAEVDVQTHRTARHEVTIELVRDVHDDGQEARAVVDSVTVRRLGAEQVTAADLRAINVGELVDWMLTRAPVVEWVDGDGTAGAYLGAGHPAAAEARRAAGRRTGKRGDRVVTPQAVAEVAATAPSRRLGAALASAFPGVGRRTLMAALAEARAAGLVEHTNRSRTGR